MKKRNFSLLTLVLITVITAGALGIYVIRRTKSQESFSVVQPVRTNTTATTPIVEKQEAPTTELPAPRALPVFVDHDIPFTSQAPHGNWDQPYQDACEEAALLVAHAAIGHTTLTPDVANKEILRLVDFQNQHGDFHNTTAEETAQLARDVYGYTSVRVEENPSVDSLKRALASDELIIAPMAGQLLGNPFFTPPGPAYHMFVIKGYDDEAQEFIAHDVGTRRGANYRYTYATILRAIHDWTGSKDTITQGAKRVVIISLDQ